MKGGMKRPSLVWFMGITVALGVFRRMITITDRSDGRVVAEKLTDDRGYAIFDVPAGSYTIMGIGGEPQNVVVSPGQRVGLS